MITTNIMLATIELLNYVNHWLLPILFYVVAFIMLILSSITPINYYSYFFSVRVTLGLEILSAIIPTVVVILLIIPGLLLLYQQDLFILSNSIINCLGQQWNWNYSITSLLHLFISYFFPLLPLCLTPSIGQSFLGFGLSIPTTYSIFDAIAMINPFTSFYYTTIIVLGYATIVVLFRGPIVLLAFSSLDVSSSYYYRVNSIVGIDFNRCENSIFFLWALFILLPFYYLPSCSTTLSTDCPIMLSYWWSTVLLYNILCMDYMRFTFILLIYYTFYPSFLSFQSSLYYFSLPQLPLLPLSYSHSYLILSLLFLTIPLITILQLYTTSIDVIHSWGLYSFTCKIDAIPGRLNFTFTLYLLSLGEHRGFCYELCGQGHYGMQIISNASYNLLIIIIVGVIYFTLTSLVQLTLGFLIVDYSRHGLLDS